MDITDMDLTTTGVLRRRTAHIVDIRNRRYSSRLVVNSLFRSRMLPYYDKTISTYRIQHGLALLDNKFEVEFLDNVDRGSFATGYTNEIEHYHRISKYYDEISTSRYCDRCGRLTTSHFSLCNYCSEDLKNRLNYRQVMRKLHSAGGTSRGNINIDLNGAMMDSITISM